MQITPNIHLISLGYVNAYLINESDGLTLIDVGMSFHYKKLIAAIQALGLDPSQIKTVLLTHGDPDHVGCISKLRKIADFKVYASQLVADALKEGHPSRPLNFGPVLGFLIGLLEPLISNPADVDEILKEGDSFPVLDGMSVYETPGHTPGHLSFYLTTQKLLFAGDSLRADNNGLLAGNIGLVTWSADALFASIDKQSQLGAEIVAVGHGPLIYDVRADKFPTS